MKTGAGRLLSVLTGGTAQPSRLWPTGKGGRMRVDYEDDAAFHRLYDHARAKTQMEDSDNAYRRLRHYGFPGHVEAIRNVPGDLCEAGCFRGLSAYLIASLLKSTGQVRPFHICDSFEGLSEFDSADKGGTRNHDTPEGRRKFMCSQETVQANLSEFGFISYHKGWIPEPFEALADRRFALVHVDVDLYQPTRDSLEFFWPRLSPGGIIVCDDYGSLSFPGAKTAMDEFRAECDGAFFLAAPSGQAILLKR